MYIKPEPLVAVFLKILGWLGVIYGAGVLVFALASHFYLADLVPIAPGNQISVMAAFTAAIVPSVIGLLFLALAEIVKHLAAQADSMRTQTKLLASIANDVFRQGERADAQ